MTTTTTDTTTDTTTSTEDTSTEETPDIKSVTSFSSLVEALRYLEEKWAAEERGQKFRARDFSSREKIANENGEKMK